MYLLILRLFGAVFVHRIQLESSSSSSSRKKSLAGSDHRTMCRALWIGLLAAIPMVASSQSDAPLFQFPRYISPEDVSELTQDATHWISLHPGVEFLSASPDLGGIPFASQVADQQFPQKQRNRRRRLESADEEEEEEEETSSSTSTKTEDNSQYRVQPFVEGVSDYDAYQQAWRLLGFMIDCNTVQSVYNNNNNNNNEKHSGDSGTGEGCTRYVLWAAVSLVIVFIYAACVD